MLSEFENNLNAELPILMEKRIRKLSIPKIRHIKSTNKSTDENLDDTGQDILPYTNSKNHLNCKWPQQPNYINSRVISVIDEASV